MMTTERRDGRPDEPTRSFATKVCGLTLVPPRGGGFRRKVDLETAA
jgi:hypothetical protein